MSDDRVRFTCPRCGKRYKTPRERLEAAGGQLGVLCSACAARMRVRLVEGGAETDLLADVALAGEAHGEHAEAEEAASPEGGPHGGAPGSPIAGVHIGRYQLESVVGRGGMGTVYKAFDPSTNRSVALKVLPVDAPPEDAARFEREVQVQGNIHHPHLMPIFDSGTSAGFRWYTMELVRQPLNLRDLLVLVQSGEAQRSPHLRPASTLAGLVRHILLPLCRAIYHANAREGVLHRDLSPFNVLIDAIGLRPYVIDFGVCTLIERKNPRLANLPAETSPVIEGQRKVTGTLAFMPPEQLRGQADRRGDVWALGALLHASVTGEPPLQPVHKQLVSKAERIDGVKLLIEHAEREGNATELAEYREKLRALEEGRERTVTDLHKDILHGNYQPRPPWLDPSLDAVIAKAMQVDPEKRYRTAKALADDLETWLAGGAVMAVAEGQNPLQRVAYRARLGLRRHKALVGLAVVGLLAGGAYTLWNRAPTERPLAERKAEAEKRYRDAMASRRIPGPRPDDVLLRRWIALDPEDDAPWKAYQQVLGERQRDQRDTRILAAKRALATGLESKLPAAIAAAGAQLEEAAGEMEDGPQKQELLNLARGYEPVSFRTGSSVPTVRQIDPRGHVEPPNPGMPRALPAGRWVLVLEHGGRQAWAPFEVLRGVPTPEVTVATDPAQLPEGTVYVAGGRVKGPLGETQVPALLWERTEVTVERYGAWLATLPAEEQAQRVPRVAGALVEAPRPLWDRKEGKFIPPKSLAALVPVEGISLYDARAFAAAQGRRLPTAQEWAWGATGPFAAPTPVGSLDALFALPLVVGPGAQRASAVGGSSDDVGPFGLLDMAGNVAEWTSTLTTLEGTNGWLVMGSGYGLPPERAIVTRAVAEPGWKPLQGVGFRCVLPVP